MLTLAPGFAALAAVAGLSMLLSSFIQIGGKHPVEAAVIGILVGIAARNCFSTPERLRAGIKSFANPLALGIVLLGAALNFQTLLSQGLRLLFLILTCMILGATLIYGLARKFKLTPALSILLALGTSICGGTAIAVTAPIINAREEETSYAIGTIALWGLAGILFYPLIARIFGVPDFAFGVFAGTAIHSTPQVVGAGFIYSDLAGQTATAVKLVRNCFLAPAAVIVAFWWNRTYNRAQTRVGGTAKHALPWFLFGYFIMAWLNTQGFFSPRLIAFFSNAGKFLVLMGMVGVGFSTQFSAFRKIGIAPLLIGLAGSLTVALTSILGIILLF